jgi:hypothetical protein
MEDIQKKKRENLKEREKTVSEEALEGTQGHRRVCEYKCSRLCMPQVLEHLEQVDQNLKANR